MSARTDNETRGTRVCADNSSIVVFGPVSVEAVRAHFVGSTSADLMVIADAVIADALASAGDDVSAADALRPALDDVHGLRDRCAAQADAVAALAAQVEGFHGPAVAAAMSTARAMVTSSVTDMG